MRTSERTAELLPYFREAQALVKRVKPIFHDRSPEAIGCALVELTAILIRGHSVPGDERETARMRAGLLAAHVAAISKLINTE